MAVTTPVAERAMARRSEERAARRGFGLRLVLLLLLCILLLVGIGVLVHSGLLSRLLSLPSATRQASDAPRLAFVYPPDTPDDRILLHTSVAITLTHLDKAPDQVTLSAPPGGDIPGSFTWTVIPHQGSHVVRRLIGETEWQGRVFKMCEALDDEESPTPRFAERYFPINNSGDRYHLPMTIDYHPFLELLNGAIAQIHIGQRPLGEKPPAAIAQMAEKLIPLCTGQGGTL